MLQHNFRNLKIWQKGLDIVDLVYQFVEVLPSTERYNLSAQLIRCVCSIPSNIAEGSGRRTKKDFSHFLSIALSSAYELETHLIICERRQYGKKEFIRQLIQEIQEEQRMIHSYRSKLV